MVHKTDDRKKYYRWVWGNRTQMWYLVPETDRDWDTGVSQEEMEKLGPKRAIPVYTNRVRLLMRR